MTSHVELQISVTTMNGSERIVRTGFTQALIRVKTAAAMNSVHHWSP